MTGTYQRYVCHFRPFYLMGTAVQGGKQAVSVLSASGTRLEPIGTERQWNSFNTDRSGSKVGLTGIIIEKKIDSMRLI